MINDQVVRELAEFDADGAPVTTCYLDVDGRQNVRPVDVERELDRLVRRASAHVADEPSVGDDLQRFQAHVRNGFERKGGVRGLAMFSCSPRELWRVIPLPVRVHSRITIGHAPALGQLESIVQELRPIGVILVDRQRSRLFVYEMGELVERSEVVDELPRDYDVRDQSARGSVEPHVDELVHQHLRHAASAAFQLFNERKVGLVTVGGSPEATAEVEALLHPYLKERLTERIRVGAGATVEEVHEQVLEVQAQAERAAEATAVARLRDAVGAGRKGVAGLAGTLGALHERRADHLLVSDDYAEAGWRCGCGALAAVGPTCPSCGATMERVDDVVEEAVHEALAQSCRVEVCVGNADLDVMGRIGALLRF
ncbi:baeRF10 domain-containing protein [Actinomarinicola tropica]|uniref:eRF1 domain-containing protein n=1 Tax=Actinomarinicola tropica TaxID=2789776 RepID=A0A5Q2RQV8_9ACTN|nr:hypothetical protein [Actinomarinicola tropica]QGG95575.1 hypothetical protein GH723_10980 [Actinomarinicola tropica]